MSLQNLPRYCITVMCNHYLDTNYHPCNLWKYYSCIFRFPFKTFECFMTKFFTTYMDYNFFHKSLGIWHLQICFSFPRLIDKIKYDLALLSIFIYSACATSLLCFGISSLTEPYKPFLTEWILQVHIVSCP